MNGFAALDIPPCRRYVVVKATAGFAVCRLILKLLLFYSCLDFTQNLGKTQKKRRDRNHAKSSPFQELLQILFYGNSATGNALLYISLSSVDFGRVRPIQGRTLFLFCL